MPDATAAETAQKLAEVFMPYASRRRKDVVSRQGRFVHYTSAAAGLNIINTRAIWMRSTTCMADYSEVQHGFRILSKQASLNVLTEVINDCVADVGKEAIGLFNQWWNDTQFQTYIASISEHDASEDTHGRLSMWRAFGRTSARVAFVLKVPLEPLSADVLNVLFSPVGYFTESQVADELAQITRNVQANQEYIRGADRQIVVATVFYMLVLAVICQKHEGFHEEREWRIIYNPKRRPSDHVVSSVEVVDGVPQIVYKIPLGGGPPAGLDDVSIPKLLDRVLIGPSQYPWAMYEAFVAALSNAGVTDAGSRVFVSGIPIRT